MNIPTMFKKEERIHCCLGKFWNLVAMQLRRVIVEQFSN